MYHGKLKFDSTTDDLIDAADVLPYPNDLPPISMTLTEFHLVLLYKDRVLAHSVLDKKLTYEEMIPLVSENSHVHQPCHSRCTCQKPNETILGMATDTLAKAGKTYWVYTDQALYELGAKSEDRDVWKTYLDKQQHELALRYAKVRARPLALI